MAKRFLVSTALIAVILGALAGCGNRPPEITGVIASPSSVQPNEKATITCTATDANGDQLTYEWESVDEGGTTYADASFEWTAPANTGPYRFYVTVSDGAGGVSYDSSLIVTVAYKGISAVTLLAPQRIETREVDLIWTSAEQSWIEYKIYRSKETPGADIYGEVIGAYNYTKGNTRFDTTFTDDVGVEPGKDYYYVIQVTDSTGNKVFSNEIMVSTKSFELVGSQSLGGGHGVRLANAGNYIFCAAREQSVKGFTVTNSGPNPAANIPKPNGNSAAWAWDLVISSSNLLHVAFGVEGYMVYDITNQLNPLDTLQVDVATLGGEARAIYTVGSNIFIGCTEIASNTHTLVWGTVTGDPLAWTLIDIDTLNDEPTDIYVSSPYIYVTVQDAGLEILSYNEVNGLLTSEYLQSTNKPANRVYVSGSYAYVAASEWGLPVIDVSNPSSPYEAALWQDDVDGNDAQGIYFSGARAYLADGEHGLRVLDIQDPLNPFLIGTKDLSEEMPGGYRVMDVWVRSQGSETQAILADWYDAIHMIKW